MSHDASSVSLPLAFTAWMELSPTLNANRIVGNTIGQDAIRVTLAIALLFCYIKSFVVLWSLRTFALLNRVRLLWIRSPPRIYFFICCFWINGSASRSILFCAFNAMRLPLSFTTRMIVDVERLKRFE